MPPLLSPSSPPSPAPACAHPRRSLSPLVEHPEGGGAGQIRPPKAAPRRQRSDPTFLCDPSHGMSCCSRVRRPQQALRLPAGRRRPLVPMPPPPPPRPAHPQAGNSLGEVKNVEFPFDMDKDTSLSVSIEMAEQLEQPSLTNVAMAELIDAFLLYTVPGWRPCVRVGKMVVNKGRET